MTWNFIHGGKLKFSYYSDSFEDFKKRFQGKEFSYIAIDEITHCTFDKFKYLITCNRNSHGTRSSSTTCCRPCAFGPVRATTRGALIALDGANDRYVVAD